MKNREHFMLVLKAALDHNAAIVTMATVYASTFDQLKPYKQKSVIKEFEKLGKQYEKIVSDIMAEIQKNLEGKSGR